MADALVIGGKQFQFDLIAPEKIEVSEMEERVILPGEQGDFMVLAGHELLLAALRPGVISVFHANDHVIRYFIEGGFADVGNNHCTVLTPQVTPVTKLVADKLQLEIEKLQAQYGTENDEAIKSRLEGAMSLLTAKLETAQRYNS